MQQKQFTPTIKAASDDGTASFVIARLNDHVDEDGDLTLSGYFGRQAAVVVPVHDWKSVPIGHAVVYEKGNEAIADVRFNMAIEAARDWHSAIKFDLESASDGFGPLQEYSYGFAILPGAAKAGTFNGRNVRVLSPLKDGSPGVDVIEVSPVMLGAAGRGITRTLVAKHLNDRDEAAIIATALGHLDALAAEDAELKAIEERIFLDRAARLLAELDQTDVKDRSDLDRRHWYAQVPAPSEEFARAAFDVSRAAAKELGIPAPRLRWFDDEPPAAKQYRNRWGSYDGAVDGFSNVGRVVGVCQPDQGVIWVKTGRPLQDTLVTVAHEVKHLDPTGNSERDAYAYGRSWIGRFPTNGEGHR